MDLQANHPPSDTIGTLTPDEMSLCLNSWHLSLVPPKGRSPDPRLRAMRKSDAHALLTVEIDAVMARYPLRLAYRRDGVVLGWICADAADDGVTVWYVYVKSPYRRQGIGRALLRGALMHLGPLAGDGLHYRYRTHAEPTARRYGFELGR